MPYTKGFHERAMAAEDTFGGNPAERQAAYWKSLAVAREAQLTVSRNLVAEQDLFISSLQDRIQDLENQLAWLQGMDRVQVELVAGVLTS